MSFFSKLSYSDLWKAIIRPPRDEYILSDLGPKELKTRGQKIKRTDLQLKNKRGLTLECSFFEPVERVQQHLPCVIYLHGNSSSRIEALQCIPELLSQNIQLFCFDFAGCGLSEGEYISLGHYECDDVEAVINYLRESDKVLTIGLWGRSMGAATALMYADKDPSIGGIVVDSAFTSLKNLAKDLCKQYTKIPNFVLSGAMALINSTIKKKAKFELNQLTPIEHVSAGFIPALFVAAKQDTFIKSDHTVQLHKAYSGDKNIILVDGDHNSPRPRFLLDSIAIFFHNTLLCDTLPTKIDKSKEQNISSSQSDCFFNQQRNIGNQNQVAQQLGGAFEGEYDEEEDDDDGLK